MSTNRELDRNSLSLTPTPTEFEKYWPRSYQPTWFVEDGVIALNTNLIKRQGQKKKKYTHTQNTNLKAKCLGFLISCISSGVLISSLVKCDSLAYGFKWIIVAFGTCPCLQYCILSLYSYMWKVRRWTELVEGYTIHVLKPVFLGLFELICKLGACSLRGNIWKPLGLARISSKSTSHFCGS